MTDQKGRRIIEYRDDPSIVSYGFWECRECGKEFYGGGEALHKDACNSIGYGSCTWIFGPQVDQCPRALIPHGITTEMIDQAKAGNLQ